METEMKGTEVNLPNNRFVVKDKKTILKAYFIEILYYLRFCNVIT